MQGGRGKTKNPTPFNCMNTRESYPCMKPNPEPRTPLSFTLKQVMMPTPGPYYVLWMTLLVVVFYLFLTITLWSFVNGLHAWNTAKRHEGGSLRLTRLLTLALTEPLVVLLGVYGVYLLSQQNERLSLLFYVLGVLAVGSSLLPLFLQVEDSRLSRYHRLLVYLTLSRLVSYLLVVIAFQLLQQRSGNVTVGSFFASLLLCLVVIWYCLRRFSALSERINQEGVEPRA